MPETDTPILEASCSVVVAAGEALQLEVAAEIEDVKGLGAHVKVRIRARLL
jgi:hypothetical protein